MTILTWIVLAIVLLGVCVSVYAGCVAGAEADAQAERELREWQKTQQRTCPTCAHHLGAEQCRINAEGECREGGGFELWEEKDA